jgi:hypothetical protein
MTSLKTDKEWKRAHETSVCRILNDWRQTAKRKKLMKRITLDDGGARGFGLSAF